MFALIIISILDGGRSASGEDYLTLYIRVTHPNVVTYLTCYKHHHPCIFSGFLFEVHFSKRLFALLKEAYHLKKEFIFAEESFFESQNNTTVKVTIVHNLSISTFISKIISVFVLMWRTCTFYMCPLINQANIHRKVYFSLNICLVKLRRYSYICLLFIFLFIIIVKTRIINTGCMTSYFQRRL